MSGCTCWSGTLRPNRAPTAPSAERSDCWCHRRFACRGSPDRRLVARSSGGSSVSCRFWARRSSRISTSPSPAGAAALPRLLFQQPVDAARRLFGCVRHGCLPRFEPAVKRLGSEHRHHFSEHGLARRKARHVGSPVDARWRSQTLVAIRARTVGAVLAAPENLHQIVVGHQRPAIDTMSQSPRPMAAAITDAVWKPPVDHRARRRRP